MCRRWGLEWFVRGVKGFIDLKISTKQERKISIMKDKILFISDRPTMSADMLIRNLSDTFEISRASSKDEISYIPSMVLVNLAGLEDFERIKTFTNTKIFLLGNQAEVDAARFDGAEYFIRPFNANEIREKLSGFSQVRAEIQKTLLLVDDDAVMIRTLRDGLSTSYKVLPANSGANALRILGKAKPDLILLDYEMPEMNGPQVLEKLRDNPDTANIPVMFLTAKSDSDSLAHIDELNTNGHMLKTLPLGEIKQIIQNFFDGE